MKLLLLFLGFQANWLICVLGGAAGLSLPGVLSTSVFLAALLRAGMAPQALVRRAALGVLAGLVLDGSLKALGWIQFPAHAEFGLPLWMLALWAGFAAVLPWMVPWLAGRRVWAVGLGLLGGPAAYLSAEALGAITVAGWPGAAGVGLAWGLAMLILPLQEQAGPA